MVIYLVNNIFDDKIVGFFSSREKAIDAMLKVYKEIVERFPDLEEDYETDVTTIKKDCELMDIFSTEEIQLDNILN